MSVKLQNVFTWVILSEQCYTNMVHFSVVMELFLNIWKKITDCVKRLYLDVLSDT
jgi:hypothetical protein